MSKRILLIPAAGVGERMKIGYPKQYYPLLDNTSMLEVTVNRLQDMHLFDQIAVVVSRTIPTLISVIFTEMFVFSRVGEKLGRNLF